VKFEPKRLPVVALRRMLSRVVLKKRASANSADRAAWQADDLLFVSNYGEGTERQISFAHFSQNAEKTDLPTLKVLGWDNRDTPLHLDDVADTLHQRLVWPEDEKDAKRWREQWQAAFTLRHLEVITTSKDLAVRLAELAGAIRDRIRTVLAIETEKGPLTRLMKAFQQALIHDLSADDFADMYAQTIAYGLLSARVAHPAHDTADAVASHIPVTNPFLKELMETFLHLGGRKRKERGGDGIDFDELGVSEVVELLDAANMEAVVRDFGDRNPDEDPVIHFYELFLKEYDAKKRMLRGVFYTPQAVVFYIVRSVHELLQTEFGLEDGLADTTTWNEMLMRHRDLRPPAGISLTEPFVQILDPATGTATFLVEVIDVIHRTLAAKWSRQRLTGAQQQVAWNEYVPKHLLPRLHGYELLMAPYAIAHMKIGLKLYETGYRFGSDERARIYLTNALEPASDDKKQREFEEWVPALAHESRAVNAIKRHQRFTVVIGNPPYSISSQNKSEWIQRLIEDYKRDLNEKKLNLDDDYIKFLRDAEHCVDTAGRGIVAMITNSSFIDGVTHRQMRKHLLETFDAVYIYDLHGSSIKKETAPDGSEDNNVFDIKQGVSISLLVKHKLVDRGLATLYHFDSYGTRATKYTQLLDNAVGETTFQTLECKPPYYFFVPKDFEVKEVYDSYFPVFSLFLEQNTGIQTKRDDLVIHFNPTDVAALLQDFRSLPPERLRQKYHIREDGRDWQLDLAIADIATNKPVILPVDYRPFDKRFMPYTGKTKGIIAYPRHSIMKYVIGKRNICLALKRQAKFDFSYVFLHTNICESCLFESAYANNSVFPLYLYPAKGEQTTLGGEPQRIPNLNAGLVEQIVGGLYASFVSDHEHKPEGDHNKISPLDILDYIYAVLHSPTYRETYKAFLRIDFPRVPFPRNAESFWKLVALGKEIRLLHLLDGHKVNQITTRYPVSGTDLVEKVEYKGGKVSINKQQYFENVPEVTWGFHIGGYQVCDKWLKDRKGLTLSKDDIAHYHKIVVALSETIRLMAEIDKVIDAHGGWPGAFMASKI
jgi:predicted helicase